MKKYHSFSLLKKFVCLCVASIALPLFADTPIRQYVGIVREHYFDSLVQFMEKYRDDLRNDGYSTYAKYIDAYLEGGFGSGFVYVASDGKNYIITNRHVISQAQSASIEFENPDTGKKTTYDNLTVLATDDDIDIAILAFPSGTAPFKAGLKLSTAAVNDGDEVWSAGFPGIGDQPMWQLGKGSVTNAKARINELLDTGISTLIQHSAQVDSGNSGGPLMVASKSEASGYTVVGINTWKAVYRESTNYAIPSSVVLDFINRTLQNKAATAGADMVQTRATKFASVFKQKDANFTSIVKYISYDMTSAQGKDAFESVNQYASTAVRNIVLDVFSDDPFEGLRYAVAYQVWEQYRESDSDGETYTAGTVSKTSDTVYASTIANADASVKIDTSWIAEQGLWRISASTVQGKKAKSSSKSSESSSASSSASWEVTAPRIARPYMLSLQVSGMFPIKSYAADGSDATVTYDYAAKNALTVQLDVFTGHFGFWGLGFFGEFENINDIKAKFIGMNTTFRIPIDFTGLALMPYAQGGLGMGFSGNFTDSDSYHGIGYYGEAGLVCSFDFDWGVKPGVGVAYNFEALALSQGARDSTDYVKQTVKVYALIAF